MSRTPLVAALALCGVIGLARFTAAQTPPSPTINNVTLDEQTAVLTISGTGFGSNPVVAVDGALVPVLTWTETQLTVAAPEALLKTPGTYRLTLFDPQRRVGDGFVVASRGQVAGSVVAPGVGGQTDGDVSGRASASAPKLATPAASGSQPPADTVPPPLVLEDPGAPYRTAIGYQALSTSTGYSNTAAGYQALAADTTGAYNAAVGYQALALTTTGSFNTATGNWALRFNTMGFANTADGDGALFSNTTGSSNTAAGEGALGNNTTGSYNTAAGLQALLSNTVGNENTATGQYALPNNTTGSSNTAAGSGALLANTTGAFSAALGAYAGAKATTGSYNLFLGAEVEGAASDTNTIRIGLPYDAAAGTGQYRTFIAGIYGTKLAGGSPVYIDGNGRLGTAVPGMNLAMPATVGNPVQAQQLQALQQQLEEQRATITELRARLANLEARIPAGAVRK